MWLLSLAVLAATPELADPGRRAVETCPIRSVSFRTPTDAWLGDECGRIFRSSDGGKGWVRAPALEKTILGAEGSRDGDADSNLSRLTWLSPTVGLAFPYDKPFSLRTVDGGATWKKVRPGTSGYVYAVETVGTHVWICDSSGALMHSADLGVSWRRHRKLFEESMMGHTDWCASISFVDAQHGWALGMKSLWQTVDGGKTWTPLTAPRAREGWLSALTRLDLKVAWIRDESGARFVTLDGGESWKTHQPARGTVLARRPDGRPVMLATEKSLMSEWEPTLEATEAEIDSRFTLDLDVLARLQALREEPLVSPQTAARVPLTHVSEGPKVRWAAAGRTVFRAVRGGPWYVAMELSAPVEQLVALESGSYLARTSAGLFKDGKPADKAAVMDFERLAGTGVGDTQRSLECLQSKPGWLSLEWEAQGCFGGTSASARVELGEKDARVRASNGYARSEKPDELATGQTLTAARALAKRFAVAATRAEEPSGCWSTTQHLATLKWQCGSEVQRELKFSTSTCGRTSVAFTGGETRSGGGDEGYARALGLIDVAQSLFATPDAGTR